MIDAGVDPMHSGECIHGVAARSSADTPVTDAKNLKVTSRRGGLLEAPELLPPAQFDG